MMQNGQRTATGEPVLVADEEITHREPNCRIVFNEDQEEGNGHLFMTTKKLQWLSADDTTKGWQVDYKAIVLHAIARDTTHFPSPCIYCQLDLTLSNNNADQEMGDGDDEDVAAPEMRLVPQSGERLQEMFDRLSEMQALHPDGDNADESTDDEDGFGDGFVWAGNVPGGMPMMQAMGGENQQFMPLGEMPDANQMMMNVAPLSPDSTATPDDSSNDGSGMGGSPNAGEGAHGAALVAGKEGGKKGGIQDQLGNQMEALNIGAEWSAGADDAAMDDAEEA